MAKQGKGSLGLNRKQSIEFFKKNKNKKGIVQTSSGLQYLIREKAVGEKPTLADSVTINQRITLIDGTILADSYSKDDADTFPLSEAIQGLKEGICLMSVGEKYRFFVPPELAWGKKGSKNKIPPYATLIFDIKLEKIV